MARADDLAAYCFKHGLRMITIADLIAYGAARQARRAGRRHQAADGFGDFVAVGYRSLVDDKHHVALVKGDVAAIRRARPRASES